MAQKKLKIALVSLTGCEGCYFEFLGLREKFVELTEKIDFVEFRLFEDDHYFTAENLDVAFIEGSPVTKENIRHLKTVRKNCKILISCGACAHIGGIYHLKNYYEKDKLFDHIYTERKGIDNIDIKPVAEYVKVDYNLPTCPINKEEFLNFLNQLIIGKAPKIKQNPVCYECITNGYDCLLQEGEICLGPITQGGCDAICTKSRQACWGCRGLLNKPQIKNLFKEFKKRGFTQTQINEVLKIFGVKDLVEKRK